MNRTARLLKNPRLLFWGKAFTELKAMNAIVVLFYLHRDLTIDQIFYLSIVFSIGTLIFEIPSGYLADRIGRKNTLMLGAFALLCSSVATWFAHGPISFILIFILLSAAFSAFSGTEEALLYDSLKELGKEKDMTHHNGRLQSARHVMKIFIPTIAAFIAKDLLEWQFNIIIGIDVFGAVSALIILWFIVEPQHTREMAVYEKSIFRESWETIRKEPFLFRAAMNKIIIFVASFIIWRIYQPFLTDYGFTVFWLGVFYLIMHICMLGGKWILGILEERIGSLRLLNGTLSLFTISIVAVFLTHTPWLIFILMLFAIVISSVREPLFAHAMNMRIVSRSRATTLSNLNVFKAIIDIPILLLTGWLAIQHVNYIFIVALALCIIVMVFFPIRKKDLILSDEQNLG